MIRRRALWGIAAALLCPAIGAAVFAEGAKTGSGSEASELPENVARATFAGGCFWCMEGPFDALEGVLGTTSGYTGGQVENPSYEQVSRGGTGHTEAVQVSYDPSRVGYDKLLEVFWRNIDPVDATGQFCDKGSQYRSGVYWHDGDQQRLAEASLVKLVEQGRFEVPVTTEIVELDGFYPAEEYHQDYYRKNPIRYRFYRSRCGRERRLQEVWGEEAGGRH